jgi:hypothetical protein
MISNFAPRRTAMRNYKALYEKGDETFWKDGSELVPKEKRNRKFRREQQKRDKIRFDRHNQESFFRREDL